MSFGNTMINLNEQVYSDSTPEKIQSVDLDVLADLGDGQQIGEPDFVVELIDLYLNQTPILLNSIRSGLAENDWISVKRMAHNLRGSSNSLGILQMGEFASDVEYLSTPDEVEIMSLLRQLEDEFAQVEKILLAERQRRTS